MTAHPLPARTYYAVFAALLGLTALTVLAARLDVGAWHTPLGLAIAVTKAALVLLFFMHVLQSHKVTWVVIGASLFWLGILFALTLGDYLTRDWLRYPEVPTPRF